MDGTPPMGNSLRRTHTQIGDKTDKIVDPGVLKNSGQRSDSYSQDQNEYRTVQCQLQALWKVLHNILGYVPVCKKGFPKAALCNDIF